MPNLRDLVAELNELILKIGQAPAPHSRRTAAALATRLEHLSAELADVGAKFDPVLRPAGTFDPGDSVTAARMIALTLVAQERYPLDRVPIFYGSGVYAIYYRGQVRPYAAYEPLSGTDHPIYVGKADPDDSNAKSSRQQGRAVSGRLREHAARIKRVASTLAIEDFECRFLVVQTGFQNSAESFLIKLFEPIWNSDTGICFGMSKHGDSATTRGNARSPWFTLHQGVSWADNPKLVDQKSKPQIHDDIVAHFRRKPPYRDIHGIFDDLVTSLRQLPLPLADEPVRPEEN